MVLPTDGGAEHLGPRAVVRFVEAGKLELALRVGALARAHGLPGDEVDRVLHDASAPRNDGVRVRELLDAAAAGDAVEVVTHGLDAVVGFDGAGVGIFVIVDTNFFLDTKISG